MTAITGTVQSVESQDWKNGIVFYHLRLEGSPRVYNCGSKNPEVKEGEHIRFTESNRKVLVETIERITKDEVKAEPKPGPVATHSNGNGAGDVANRIRRQAARRDSVTIVVAAMEANLLPYPKTGKIQDRWDRMLDLINETTNDLLEQEDGTWQDQS